jgi:hypothetical protein
MLHDIDLVPLAADYNVGGQECAEALTKAASKGR